MIDCRYEKQWCTYDRKFIAQGSHAWVHRSILYDTASLVAYETGNLQDAKTLANVGLLQGHEGRYRCRWCWTQRARCCRASREAGEAYDLFAKRAEETLTL